MRAVIQRVYGAKLSVEGKVISSIGKGFVVFLGVKNGDDEAQCQKIAAKIAKMRIFEDENGKMNKNIFDVGGQILLVSQFTLFADCRDGNRPYFAEAARPEVAEPLYHSVEKALVSLGCIVRLGVFGADMKIEQTNDGPVTIILDSADLK